MAWKKQKKTPELVTEVVADAGTRQGHAERLSRYASLKRRQVAVSNYILSQVPELRNIVKQLDNCGSWLLFRFWYLDDVRRLLAGFTCKKWLLCPACAMRRSARYVMEYAWKIQQVMAEYPGCVPVLITRTVRNGSDLGERYDHLNNAHKKMIQRRRQSLKKSTARGSAARSVMRFILGSAGSYEFKRGRNSGEWHPHSHEIALLDPAGGFEFTELIRKGKTVHVPLEFENALRNEWLQVTGDSHMIDVRRVEASDKDLLFKAVCEAFKYALKMNELTVEEQVEAYEILSHRRLLFSYGCLRGVQISDSLADDIEEALKDRPYTHEFYRFDGNSYVQKPVDENLVELVEKHCIRKGGVAKKKKRRPRPDDDIIDLGNGRCLTKADVCAWLAKRDQDSGPVPF